MSRWYAQGSGIRMDHPGEDVYLSPWRQEYPSHLGSLDMLVVWLPLVPVDEMVGNVLCCPGSHAAGLMPVRLHDPLSARRNGSMATEIVDLDRHLRDYPEMSIDTRPGDALSL